MEPSGRNRWQPVANGAAAKVAQSGYLTDVTVTPVGQLHHHVSDKR
jgi:hypothetical protein